LWTWYRIQFFFYSLHVNLSLKRYRKKDGDNFSNCFKNRIIDCSVLAISFVSWSSSVFELLVSILVKLYKGVVKLKLGSYKCGVTSGQKDIGLTSNSELVYQDLRATR